MRTRLETIHRIFRKGEVQGARGWPFAHLRGPGGRGNEDDDELFQCLLQQSRPAAIRAPLGEPPELALPARHVLAGYRGGRIRAEGAPPRAVRGPRPADRRDRPSCRTARRLIKPARSLRCAGIHRKPHRTVCWTPILATRVMSSDER